METESESESEMEMEIAGIRYTGIVYGYSIQYVIGIEVRVRGRGLKTFTFTLAGDDGDDGHDRRWSRRLDSICSRAVIYLIQADGCTT